MFDVLTVLHAPGLPVEGLGPEHRRLVQLCEQRLMPLFEVAGAMELPIGLTKVLVADLVDSGHLLIRAPAAKAKVPQRELLERVIDALKAL
ncbi:DUF742 domain-containing protein [Sphaerisporangium sp. NPDC051017]|uniref:DUF742 domain-containing protein n=1 Tax=Sphaerisporangium sp. NPDC051017 TaxID=3154636 RepID=UPI00344AAB76